jgi:hypothetical protein
MVSERTFAFPFKPLIVLVYLVALPALEPGLFALRARTKNSRQRRPVR